MPSSYSGNLLLELMADGENDGLWGDITNKNLEVLGRAISGVTTVTLAGTTHTLTVTQGTLSEGHFMVLELGGSPTGTNTITINPNTVERLYFVKNGSGEDAVFTQGSGGNVTVPNGTNAIIYCDGAGSGAKVSDFTSNLLRSSNNLSDLGDAADALTNLGLTSTAAELNKLDGFTGSSTDLNYAKDLRATGVTAAEFDKLDGLTASTVELNKLDGLTASTVELNKLDGFTGSSTDLNYAKDLRATGVTAAEFDKLDGFTGTAADLNYAKDLRATGVTAAEFDKLDGLTVSTTELNYLDGVTSNLQTQLDANIGIGQTWQDVSASRSAGTSYQNTTGKPIQISVTTRFTGNVMEVSADNSTWIVVAITTADRIHPDTNQIIVPNNHYYRLAGGASVLVWAELR